MQIKGQLDKGGYYDVEIKRVDAKRVQYEVQIKRADR